MKVRVAHLGVTHDSTVEEVRDGGRTLLIDGVPFTLRRVNGHFIREGEPSYGTRAVLLRD